MDQKEAAQWAQAAKRSASLAFILAVATIGYAIGVGARGWAPWVLFLLGGAFLFVLVMGFAMQSKAMKAGSGPSDRS